MRVLLISLLLCGTALAAPPALNTTYLFDDINFGDQTVLCDTADQIRDIASAKDPNETFLKYYNLKNDHGESTCAAYQFTAMVDSVESLGVMRFGDNAFNAWVVGISNNGIHGAALYLEAFNEVNA